VTEIKCRHLAVGERWTRCGRLLSNVAQGEGSESWPVCKVCARSCREQDKPEEPKP
jgi:hypothetical protein